MVSVMTLVDGSKLRRVCGVVVLRWKLAGVNW